MEHWAPGTPEFASAVETQAAGVTIFAALAGGVRKDAPVV